MTLPHNATTPNPPYTVWIDYGCEGWKPYDADTITDCLTLAGQYGIGAGFRITRPVTLIDAGSHTPAAALDGSYGEHTTALGCTVSLWPMDVFNTLLALDMRQPGDGRHAEVLLSAADRAAIRELLALEHADYRTTDAEYRNRR